jgi:DICT domain-containing protein
MEQLGIGEVAELTGIAVGTLRMWEQRYGFPVPQRTESGYRKYSSDDVEVLRRTLALREQGMSVTAALERALEVSKPTATPSLYGAVVAGNGLPLRPRKLRKDTLVEISRAMEDEALASGGSAVCFGAFQRERFFRQVEARWQRLAQVSDAAVVFADFPEARCADHRVCELPITVNSPLGHEWSVVIDGPGYAALLVAWEQPEERDASIPDGDRRFECFWTLDPVHVRTAARVGAALAAQRDAALGEELERMLADRPLALERPPSALTALTNRMVEYLERDSP